MGKAQKLKQQRKIEREEQEIIMEKKKKKKAIIFLLILVLLVGLVAVTVVFVNYLKNKDIRRVVIETEKGDIKLELYPEIAPKTVENFIKLTNEGFYDGTKFHRVVADFVIQGGDPLTKDNNPANDGNGGPGYAFEDEINPKSLGLTWDETKALEKLGYKYRYDINSISHEPGVISMANSGPDTNGSQFFIVTTQAQPDLNGRHTAFGRVYEGMDVVLNIKQGDIIKRVYTEK
jgi:peptidyl-prolyl cis-trans isomerase B (cyclophilin B)